MNFKITKTGAIKISQIITVIIVFALYILSDYIRIGGTMDFITEKQYWIIVFINLFLVVAIMITLRSYHKTALISKAIIIINNLKFIERADRVITGNAYSKNLDEYLIEVNEENKYQAFRRKLIRKLNLISKLFFISAKKRDTWIKQVEQELETPKEIVLTQFVRYKEVTRTSLFSGIDGKIISEDQFDTSTHNTRDIAQMVSLKALIVVLFAGMTGTMIWQLMWQGWSGVWGTLLKIFSLLIACNCAIKQAEDFVEYNIKQALNNRVNIISNFVNNDKTLKQRLIKLKEIEDKELDNALIEGE